MRFPRVMALLVFITFCNSAFALDPSICGEPPPIADDRLKGELEGKAQFLSSLLGKADLSGAIETSRTEIFSKYKNADERSNMYFEYQVCVLLMSDVEMSTSEKLEELKRIRRNFSTPIERTQVYGDVEADLKIMSPVSGSHVFLSEIIQGRSNVPHLNHYLIVLPSTTGDRYIVDGPFSVGSDGIWSARARFGERYLGSGKRFFISVLATRERLSEGTLADLPDDAKTSDLVEVIRSK